MAARPAGSGRRPERILPVRGGTLRVDPRSGILVAWHPHGSRRSLVDSRPGDALLELGWVDAAGELRTADDRGAARSVAIAGTDGRWTVETEVRQPGGLPLDATLTLAGSADDPGVEWRLALTLHGPVRLVDARFPVLRMPLGLGRTGRGRSDALVQPRGTGRLIERPRPTDLEPDDPFPLQLRPETLDPLHYPGLTFAQMLAYLDGDAGLLLWAMDTDGRPKMIKPLASGSDRVRLAFAHTLGGPDGPVPIGYAVRAEPVRGTWEDAAERYRSWSLGQPWAERPIRDRGVHPAIAAAPVPVMIRVQGVHDEGPADPITAFLPWERTLPILDRLAERLAAPLLPFVMAWEQHGPWTYPESLPPVGGTGSFTAFTAGVAERGWSPGTLANGTRWVTAHRWTGWDGRDAFARDGGPESVCRTADGGIWHEPWDAAWRASMPACLGVTRTREIATTFMHDLGHLGIRTFQLLDQNLGAVTFPCYATDHGHPDTPGPWMTDAMRSFLPEVRAAAVAGAIGAPVVLSVEATLAEPHLAALDLVDLRSVPDGHAAPHPLWTGSIPLFAFLYHELVPLSGGFSFGPEPFHLESATAVSLVNGALPGGVLQGDGRLMARDSVNFGDWDPYPADWEAAAGMLRAAVALRRDVAEPWLLHGRMERSATIHGIRTRRWSWGGRVHRLPAVLHRTWRAPDGRLALVLAAWDDRRSRIRVTDPRLADASRLTIATADGIEERVVADGIVELPPRSVAILRSR